MMRSVAFFSDITAMGRYDYHYDHAADPMEPDPGQTIEHAIGDVIIRFEELDDAIAFAISGILNRGDDVGRIRHLPALLPKQGGYVRSSRQARPAQLLSRENNRRSMCRLPVRRGGAEQNRSFKVDA
jgi:hypothetical protein